LQVTLPSMFNIFAVMVTLIIKFVLKQANSKGQK